MKNWLCECCGEVKITSVNVWTDGGERWVCHECDVAHGYDPEVHEEVEDEQSRSGSPG